MSCRITGCVNTKVSVESKRKRLSLPLTNLLFGKNGIKRIKKDPEAIKNPDAKLIPHLVTLRSNQRLSIEMHEISLEYKYSKKELSFLIQRTELDVDRMMVSEIKRVELEEICDILMSKSKVELSSSDGIEIQWKRIRPEFMFIDKDKILSIWFWPQVFRVRRDLKDGTYGFEIGESRPKPIKELERCLTDLEGIEIEGIVEISPQEEQNDGVELEIEFYYEIRP